MPKVTEMWAFIAAEKDDSNDEGLVAANFGGTWTPLVAADEKRVESLRPIAQAIARATGQSIKLVKFSAIQTLEEIKPR